MKIVNTDKENLLIFQRTWAISMKFSGKMCLMMILKATKKQSFYLYLEKAVLEKPQVGCSNWSPVFLGLILKMRLRHGAFLWILRNF